MPSAKTVAVAAGVITAVPLLVWAASGENRGQWHPTGGNTIPDGLTPREWWHIEDLADEHGIGTKDATRLSEAAIADWDVVDGWPATAACSIYYTRDEGFIRETLADHAPKPEGERAVWIETMYYAMGHNCRAPETPAPI